MKTTTSYRIRAYMTDGGSSSSQITEDLPGDGRGLLVGTIPSFGSNTTKTRAAVRQRFELSTEYKSKT
jgi:hypothetical protein